MRNSGIEWAAKVPSDWAIGMLGRYVIEMCDGPFGSSLKSSHYSDHGARVIRLQNIGSGAFIDAGKAYIDLAYFELLRRHEAKSGDLIIAGLGDANNPLGRACLVPSHLGAAMVKADCFRVRLDERELLPGFAMYFLNSLAARAEVSNVSKGATRDRINLGAVSRIRICVPSLAQQLEIVAFLDREMAEADALIEKYERLVELIEEKRIAMIAKAVTMGFDSGSAIKDSGNPAIGNIPRTWSVLPAKHVLEFVTSGSRGWADYYSDAGDLFLRIGNLSRTGIDLDLSEPKYVRPPVGAEGRRTRARAGDLLISITADLGSVAIVPEIAGSTYVSQHVALCRPKEGVHARWLAYAFFSRSSKVQLLEAGYGGTKIQLSLSDVRNVSLPLPSFQEQEEIARRIDVEVAKFVCLISLVTESINVVKERRACLITAAVTGEINVSKYKRSQVTEAIA